MSESCRSLDWLNREGDTSKGIGPPGAEARVAFQEVEFGPKVDERALWRYYEAVAPYLKE